MTFTSTLSTVLGIERPPGLPVMRRSLPSFRTMIGHCELSIFLPGPTRLGAVPIEPFVTNGRPEDVVRAREDRLVRGSLQNLEVNP